MISIDPSIVNTGIANFDETKRANDPSALRWYGVIKTKKKTSLGDKIIDLHNQLHDLMIKFKEHHTKVIIERPDSFTYQKRMSYEGKDLNYDAINKNNIAVGVIASTMIQFADEILFFTATEWKGKQSKQVTLMVINAEYGLKLTKSQHDMADAIGLGKWWLRQVAMEDKIK